MKYTAWAVYENGDKVEYQGLTKGRALWRYHWFARQLLNNPRSSIKSYGWLVEA